MGFLTHRQEIIARAKTRRPLKLCYFPPGKFPNDLNGAQRFNDFNGLNASTLASDCCLLPTAYLIDDWLRLAPSFILYPLSFILPPASRLLFP
jgi:hypothetical protein